MTRGKIVVGLTGGYASGKSTVLRIFKKMGALTVDADKLAHQLLKKDKQLIAKISKIFGPQYVTARKESDRKKLAELVFSNRTKRLSLERIMHPLILKDIKLLAHKSKSKVVVAEVALLFEKKWDKYFDFTVAACCSASEQLKRAVKRDKISFMEAQKRIDLQMPLAQKVLRADYAVNTGLEISDLKRSVKLIYEHIGDRSD